MSKVKTKEEPNTEEEEQLSPFIQRLDKLSAEDIEKMSAKEIISLILDSQEEDTNKEQKSTTRRRLNPARKLYNTEGSM
jgi:hypothetical protein